MQFRAEPAYLQFLVTIIEKRKRFHEGDHGERECAERVVPAFEPMDFGMHASLLERLDISGSDRRENHFIPFPANELDGDASRTQPCHVRFGTYDRPSRPKLVKGHVSFESGADMLGRPACPDDFREIACGECEDYRVDRTIVGGR